MTDKIHWVSREYGAVSTYTNLKEVVGELQEALAAEKRGEWKGLCLELSDDYGTAYVAIYGERPENEKEKVFRLQHEAAAIVHQKEEYERLKKIYG